jgi:thymidylate synthase
MIRTYKRWTEEDDNQFLKIIQENVDNRNKAFFIASKKLDRTIDACRLRWYSVLSNPTNPHYKGTIFLLHSRKTYYTNKSTMPIIKTKMSTFKKILKLLSIKK